jgi:hypothetical protein
VSADDPVTYWERRQAGVYDRMAAERAAEREAADTPAAAAAPQSRAGSGGGPSSLTDLTDVTGDPGPGKAPIGDASGQSFPLTEVATQAYVDEQVGDALGRWAELDERLSFVDAFAAPWEASNASVVLTPDGVAYGPYADGSAAGGSLRCHGLDGQPLAAVRNLAYWMRYLDDQLALLEAGAAPYARVFTEDADGVAHDAAFTPGSQTYSGLGAGPFQEFVASAGMWRYDADDGTGGVPLADLQAAHPDDVITKITITLGYTAGRNLSGLLRWVQLNGNRYTFGSA